MKPVAKTRETVKRRPAETTGILAGVVAALFALFGVELSTQQAAAVVVLVGAVPSLVTWLKER